MQHASLFDDPGTAFQRLIFPALVIGYRFAAVASRLTRSTMLEVINQDYVRTARSKGLNYVVVVIRHALPNAYLPILTVSALLFGVFGRRRSSDRANLRPAGHRQANHRFGPTLGTS